MDHRDSRPIRFPTRVGGPNLFQRAGNHFQSTTVSALIGLLPIIIPVAIIVYVVNLVDSMVIPMLTMAVREISGERLTIPQFWGLGLVLALLVCYLVGLTVSLTVGRSLIRSAMSVMEWIPVVRSIVRVTQQATTVVTAQFSFSRVVFLEWPREGMVAMGFVTARVEKARHGRVSGYRLHPDRSEPDIRQHGPRRRGRSVRNRHVGRGCDEAGVLRRHRNTGCDLPGPDAHRVSRIA